MKMNINEDVDRGQLTREALSLLHGQLIPKSTIYSSTSEMAFHCPFHKDVTPSMFISLRKGLYNCFSCGRKGNIESLYKELTSENLYDRLGIHNDRFSRFARITYNQFDYDTVDYNKIDNVFVNIDWNDIVPFYDDNDCFNYVVSRGISLDIAKKYKFSFAKNTRINTTVFKNRLIIPIYENGKLVSVEGRRISGDENPKVLYPKNCSVNTLFNIDNLNRHETLYLCEGLMDLCVLQSCDFFKNSSSIFGASLTRRQCDILKEFDDVVYIPDLDEAGKKTMIKLKSLNIDNISYLLLPRKINDNVIKDIGDLPKYGLSVNDLINKKWIKYIKPIENFDDVAFNHYITN